MPTCGRRRCRGGDDRPLPLPRFPVQYWPQRPCCRRRHRAGGGLAAAAAEEEEEAATCRGSRVVPGLRGLAHEAVRGHVRAQRLPLSGISRGVGGHVLGDVVRGERWRRRPVGAVVVFLVDGVRARSAQARAVKAVPGKRAWVGRRRLEGASFVIVGGGDVGRGGGKGVGKQGGGRYEQRFVAGRGRHGGGGS